MYVRDTILHHLVIHVPRGVHPKKRVLYIHFTRHYIDCIVPTDSTQWSNHLLIVLLTVHSISIVAEEVKSAESCAKLWALALAARHLSSKTAWTNLRLET